MTRSMRMSAFLGICFLAGILAFPAAIHPGQAPLSAVTEHTGTFNGQTVTYMATVAETMMDGPDGKPAGSMITTAYVRKGVQNSAGRPVMFVFNGGPGASSSPLHMGAFGPRRIINSGSGRSIGDNPYSPLDSVDLVFIDPIGTGYSRPVSGIDGRPFWSVSGDAASVKTFIKRWLSANGREESPHFLCGESYGAARAAQIVSSGSDLRFDGVLLFSMTGGPGGPDLPYMMLFPSYAVTAAFHNKVDEGGRPPDQIFAGALQFARTEYVSALLEGDSLPADKTARTAEEMSRRIGLPASFITERKLRIGRSDFMLNLLKDRGLRTGQIDARITGKLEDYAGKKPPYDDPSMFVGGTSAPTVHAYFTGELKFPASEPYKTLNLEVNSKWKFDSERAMSDPAGLVGAVMKEQPKLQLFWAAGYYDLTTPLYAGKYVLDHAGVPPERLTVAAFPTGHSVFEGDENLAHFTDAVRAFIKGGPVQSEAQAAPAITVHIKPGAADRSGRVSSVDVRMEFPTPGTRAGQPVLQMPLVIANIETVARTMQNFAASDSNGVVEFETKDDAGGAPVLFRRWISKRLLTGNLNVRYTAPINSSIPNRTGPPFALRTEGGGFSGAGSVFMLTPADSKPYRVTIRWDLSALGALASGTSSFGDGDQDAPAAPGGGLLSSFFMAGPMHRYPEKPTPTGFSSAWLGTPPFDATQLMAWSEKLHTWYVEFFKSGGDRPYRIFLRLNPINPGGGVGLTNSFVATYDQTTQPENLKLTLAHEMFHTFSPSLSGATQWFSEGLAIHYQRLLPLRAGMIDAQRFLEDLNATAARYFTNALNTTPNDQIAARFWEDTRIRVLPYDRGAMYLAQVDGRIRRASGGNRSLDDIMLAILDRKKQGLQSDEKLWVELITRELGPSAKSEFESMLSGAVILPDSDAFGPCFERRTAPLRRFDLGFDPRIMNQDKRIIRGLVEGSEADRAGLYDGDEIVNPVGLDNVQGDQIRTITMQIRRDGKVFPVTYLPRGETMETYQWFPVPGNGCR